jgi:hypothetical protein
MVGVNHNPNLDLSDISTIQKIFDLYHTSIIKENKGADDLNFSLALYFKHRGALLSKIYKEEEQVMHPVSIDFLFEKAVEHYRKVSNSYLEQTTQITVRQYERNQVQQKIRRRDLFLYPDHFQKVFNNRSYATKYFTDKYINFLLNRGSFSTLYRTPEDLNLINSWLSDYYEGKSNSELLHYTAPFDEHILVRIDSLLSGNPSAGRLNNNLLRLLLIEYSQENDQHGRIDEFFTKLKPEKFTENLKSGLMTQSDIYYLINRLAGYLASNGRTDEAIRIALVLPNRANQVKTYSMAARELLLKKDAHQEKAFILLDSAIGDLNRIRDFDFGTDYIFGPNDPRRALVLALSWVGGQEMHNIAGNYVKQIPISRQDVVIEQWIEGTAGSGQYYLAYTSIPDITSAVERLKYYNEILVQESAKQPMDEDWRTAIEGRLKLDKWEFLQYESDLY